MFRIAGINLPEQKQIDIGLTYIYGIGRPLALKILKQAKIDSQKKIKHLTEKEAVELRKIIESGNYKIEGDLRREIMENIKRLKEIKCWRGIRHLNKLPVRGQKTKKNARTVKGKKKTMGSGKKKATAFK